MLTAKDKRFSGAHAMAAAALFVALSSGAYAAGIIGPSDIGENAIRGKHIKAGSVGETELATGAVHAGHIARGNVRKADIGPRAIGSSELAKGSVGAPKVAPGVIGTEHISTDAVKAPQIAPGVIGSQHIAPGAIGAAQIAAGAIGPMSISENAIGSQHIKDGIIGPSDIGENAILPRHIDFPIGAVGSFDDSNVISNGGPQTLITETFTLDDDAVVISLQGVQIFGNSAGTVELAVLVDGAIHGGIWREDIDDGETETLFPDLNPFLPSAGEHTIELQALAGAGDVTFEQATLNALILPFSGVSPSM